MAGRILAGKMASRDYLTSEVVEDLSDGLMTRREALRRLSLFGGPGPIRRQSLSCRP